MSRGPGKHQRRILAEIERDGYSIVTSPDMTDSEKVASRRAARSLAGSLTIDLVPEKLWETDEDGNHTTYSVGHVAYPHDPNRLTAWVHGLDGKIYRTRNGQPGTTAQLAEVVAEGRKPAVKEEAPAPAPMPSKRLTADERRALKQERNDFVGNTNQILVMLSVAHRWGGPGRMTKFRDQLDMFTRDEYVRMIDTAMKELKTWRDELTR